MGYIIAADIGGTKLATALFDIEGKLIKRLEKKSEKKDGERLFRSFIESCDELCAMKGIERRDIQGISVGLPGIVDANKGIALFQNNLPWPNFPFVDRVKAEFPSVNVYMDNDVHMAAWGEFAIRQLTIEPFIYITLSTGISCCSIYGGSFIRGSGMAGEIGLSLADEKGKTLEETVSGPVLEAKGQKVFGNSELTLKDIMAYYYAGDERAISIVNEAIIALAQTIHQLLVYADPAYIVLGGGVFNHHPQLVDLVRRKVGDYLKHPLLKGKQSRIEGSILKGDAGLKGASMRIAKEPIS